MMRFLAISFVVVLFSSCSLRTTEGLRKIDSAPVELSNPYFSNPDLDYLYKAKIQVYKRNFGGIFIIKKTDQNTHRLVMTTEFGNKLLDMEYDGIGFTKNFVVEDLDRKFILNVLKKDFKLLLDDKIQSVETYESDNKYVYKTRDGKGFNFYFFDKNLNQLDKIVNTTKTKEKVEVQYSTVDGRVADQISLVHRRIKLRIDLEKFK